MSRRVIERSQWVDFVDAFSRQHDGWLIAMRPELVDGIA
jgi:hypothetical protein